MDVRQITYGETALDKLVQWLRSTGQPQEIDIVIEQYLTMLRELVVEENKA